MKILKLFLETVLDERSVSSEKSFILKSIEGSFKKVGDETYDINGEKLTWTEIQELLNKIDPVANMTNGKSVEFEKVIVKWLIGGKRLREDAENMQRTLKKFKELQHQQIKLPKKAVEYSSPGEMMADIEKLSPSLSVDDLKSQYPGEVVAVDGNFILRKISTWEDAEICFKDSGWCVQHKNHFDQYKPPYYMVTLKEGKTEKRFALLHVNSTQLKDVHDTPLTLEAMNRIKPFIEKLFDLDKIIANGGKSDMSSYNALILKYNNLESVPDGIFIKNPVIAIYNVEKLFFTNTFDVNNKTHIKLFNIVKKSRNNITHIVRVLIDNEGIINDFLYKIVAEDPVESERVIIDLIQHKQLDISNNMHRLLLNAISGEKIDITSELISNGIIKSLDTDPIFDKFIDVIIKNSSYSYLIVKKLLSEDTYESDNKLHRKILTRACLNEAYLKQIVELLIERGYYDPTIDAELVETLLKDPKAAKEVAKNVIGNFKFNDPATNKLLHLILQDKDMCDDIIHHKLLYKSINFNNNADVEMFKVSMNGDQASTNKRIIDKKKIEVPPELLPATEQPSLKESLRRIFSEVIDQGIG